MALLQGARGDDDNGDPNEQSGPDQMLEAHHRNTLWIPWTLVLLGAWLLVAPFSFGYPNGTAHPSRMVLQPPRVGRSGRS
ncbi:MAG: hypothetical protein ACR2G7_06605 [Acidimicrobiales bacterium]